MRGKKTKIISIDFGKARIGFAVSDELKIFANALPHIEAKASLELTAEAVIQYINTLATQGKFEVETIVVGLPLHMSGEESPISATSRAFAEKLQARTSASVVLFDERLTSVQAERTLIDADFTRKKRKSFVDRVSAAILLQSYLDSRPRREYNTEDESLE